MSTLKFYDCQTAPSPRRVRIFIAEKGLDIPVVEVDLANRQQHSDEFILINPHRTVPVLALDDGTHLTTSVGIIQYLEAIHDKPALLGRDAVERGLVADLNWTIEQRGFMAVGEAFRNRSKAFANSVFTGKQNHRQIPELIERGRARTVEFFEMLDELLQDKEYVAGDSYSVADITAFVTIDFAKWIKLAPAEDQTALKRWYNTVAQRPAVKNS